MRRDLAAIVLVPLALTGCVKPEEPEEILRQLGADYVVVCRREGWLLAKLPQGSMMRALQTGSAISFLEPVKLGDGTSPLLVWRVRK